MPRTPVRDAAEPPFSRISLQKKKKKVEESTLGGGDACVEARVSPSRRGRFGEDPSKDRAYPEGVGLAQVLHQLQIAGSRGNATKHRKEKAETAKTVSTGVRWRHLLAQRHTHTSVRVPTCLLEKDPNRVDRRLCLKVGPEDIRGTGVQAP